MASGKPQPQSGRGYAPREEGRDLPGPRQQQTRLLRLLRGVSLHLFTCCLFFSAAVSLSGLIFMSLGFFLSQGGWRGEALRHQQDEHRLRFRGALQPVRVSEGAGAALPAHVSGPTQRLAQRHAGLSRRQSATVTRLQ